MPKLINLKPTFQQYGSSTYIGTPVTYDNGKTPCYGIITAVRIDEMEIAVPTLDVTGGKVFVTPEQIVNGEVEVYILHLHSNCTGNNHWVFDKVI